MNKYNTLVISGGAFRGIAHLGALKYLQEKNILEHIETFICCSVGSIITILLSVGYVPDELHEFLKLIDFNNLKNIQINNLLNSFGLDDGNIIIQLIESLIYRKTGLKNPTFLELYNANKKKIIITTSCLNNKKDKYFDYTNSPNMKILLAIRMSISLPIIFTPVLYENMYYVDGGVLNFYPINKSENINTVLGIVLIDKEECNVSINSLEDILLHTLICGMNSSSLSNLDIYNKQTIRIELSNISYFTDLNIDEKNKLFDAGYNSALQFFIKNN